MKPKFVNTWKPNATISSHALGFTANALNASAIDGFCTAPGAAGTGFVSRRKRARTTKSARPKPPNTQNG